MRDFPRLAQTHLAYVAPDGGWGVHGRSIDLALHGLGLELSAPVRENTPCTISLSLDGELVEMNGHVVRCRPLGDRFEVACVLGRPSRAYLRALGKLFADAMADSEA